MPVAYVRFSLLGTLPGGEVWSVNPAYGGAFETNPPTPAQLQQWADDVVSLGDALVPVPLRNLLSNAGALTSVRASAYNDDGTLDSYAEAVFSSPVVGSLGLACPPTTAVVLSLYSATVGRSGRGRIFWPALGLSLDPTSGRIALADASDMADAAGEMLSAIEDAAPATWNAVLAVHSQKDGARHPITQIKVGDVPDSQRGRKDALSEARAIVVYPPA